MLLESWKSVLPPLGSRAQERQFPRPASVPDDDVLHASGAVIGEVRLVRINVFDPAEGDYSGKLVSFIPLDDASLSV